MIPLKDENPTSRIPVLTIALLVINSLIYIYQLYGWFNYGSGWEHLFLLKYGAVPSWVLGGPPPVLIQQYVPWEIYDQWMPRILTLFSAMFLHGGFMHVAGNMLYLWIFGNNIEDALGYGRFIVFYLLGGVLASLAHVIINPSSQIPMVGASGAIAAVMGAYLVLYPRARVLVLFWFFFIATTARIPAVYLLGIWFLMQFFMLGQGVAWMAHVGGFVAGMLLIRLFLPARRVPPPPPRVTYH